MLADFQVCISVPLMNVWYGSPTLQIREPLRLSILLYSHWHGIQKDARDDNPIECRMIHH